MTALGALRSHTALGDDGVVDAVGGAALLAVDAH
jgi:hypothetical protein